MAHRHFFLGLCTTTTNERSGSFGVFQIPDLYITIFLLGMLFVSTTMASERTLTPFRTFHFSTSSYQLFFQSHINVCAVYGYITPQVVTLNVLLVSHTSMLLRSGTFPTLDTDRTQDYMCRICTVNFLSENQLVGNQDEVCKAIPPRGIVCPHLSTVTSMPSLTRPHMEKHANHCSNA